MDTGFQFISYVPFAQGDNALHGRHGVHRGKGQRSLNMLQSPSPLPPLDPENSL
jgi:hypothetical protein